MQLPGYKDGGSVDRRTVLMQDMIAPWQRLLRVEVLVLLLIFAVFHYYRLAHFQLSVDDEYESYRNTGNNWIITGRWAAYVFLRFFVPQSILPFFPTFLFGLGICISYPLLLRSFGVARLQPVHYLAFPLYAGFPTWQPFMSFTTMTCFGGVAMLVVVLALDRFRAVLDGGGNRVVLIANALLCVVGVTVATGFYQAFFLAFAALGLAIVLLRQQEAPPTFFETFRRLVVLGSLLVVGLALYAFVAQAFRRAFHVEDAHYIEAFINLRALIEAPLSVLAQTGRSIGAVYGGRAAVYTIDTWAFPAIIVSGLLAVAFWPSSSRAARLLRIALATGILCVPFLQHLVNSGNMPLRTLVAIPAVFWLFAMLGLTARHRPISLGAFAATVLGVLQIVYASNLYLAAGYFARIHDQELSSAVYARIAEANPDFDGQKIYTVDIFGSYPFVTHYARPYSTTGGYSFFEWDSGNDERMLDFMRLIGYTNLREASLEQRRRDLEEFAHMPSWPARDSVRVVGGITLVKLGPAPGFPLNNP